MADEEVKDTRPMRRFRLKVGFHTTKGKKKGDAPIFWKPGDVIETQSDLVKIHGADKFQELASKSRPAVEVEVDDDEPDDTDAELPEDVDAPTPKAKKPKKTK